ncbi:MAG TPA: hypothetical protein VH678_03370 [Xanthobacteraceae bacterium]
MKKTSDILRELAEQEHHVMTSTLLVKRTTRLVSEMQQLVDRSLAAIEQSQRNIERLSATEGMDPTERQA